MKTEPSPSELLTPDEPPADAQQATKTKINTTTRAPGPRSSRTKNAGTQSQPQSNPSPASNPASVPVPDQPRLDQIRCSEPWMNLWLSRAPYHQSFEAVCQETQISLYAVIQGRLSDPQFDEACLVFEQILHLRIEDKVRLKALESDDPRWVTIYLKMAKPCWTVPYPSSIPRAPKPVLLSPEETDRRLKELICPDEPDEAFAFESKILNRHVPGNEPFPPAGRRYP